jgi:hypothetical protein
MERWKIILFRNFFFRAFITSLAVAFFYFTIIYGFGESPKPARETRALPNPSTSA